MAVLFWLIIILVCVVAEIHTNAFLAVFVAAGAILPFFLALAGVPFALQAVLWLVISGALIVLLRPYALHRFRRGSVVDLATPSRSPMTNQTGFVEENVGDEGHPGRVKIKGETWRAVTDSGESIPSGAQVIVRRTHGTTLWVERYG